MPSLTASREHENAAAVMAAGRRYRETIAATLLERLAADGALEALELAPAPDDPIIAEQTAELSEDATGAVVANLKMQAEMAPVRLPDLDNLPRLAIWMIAFYTAKMLAADDLMRQERQEDYVARRQRDDAAAAAYDVLVRMRKYVAGVLDEEAAASLLDVDGQTPRKPFRLRDTLAYAVGRLRKPDTHFPQARFQGAEPDWSQLADELEAVLVPLDEAIRRIEDERTAAEALLEQKREAFESHRTALMGWRMMVQGMAIAGGDRQLADRFKLPQPARRSGEPDDGGFDDGGGLPGTGDDAGDGPPAVDPPPADDAPEDDGFGGAP